MKTVLPLPILDLGSARFGNNLPIALIAGPCQLESRDHAMFMAAALAEIGKRLNIGIVYKTSFDKANRTSATAKRGIGLEAALPIFQEIRSKVRPRHSHGCARELAMRGYS